MELIDITTENEATLRSGSWQVTFWVPWGKPSFRQLSALKKGKGRKNVAVVNVEENRRMAERYGVFVYPTTLVLVDGAERRRTVGFSKEF